MAALLLLGSGCYSGVTVGMGEQDDPMDPAAGVDDDDSGDSENPPRAGGAEMGDHYAQIGLRRMSAHEYDESVRYLLGDLARTSEDTLPHELPDDDEDFPFEVHYEVQIVSNTLITAAETLAQDHVEALLADPSRRDDVVGCTPDGAADEACMRSFVERFGRRAFRRPLTGDEVERYLELQTCTNTASDHCGFAADADDFYEGVAAIISSMLVSPRFLYRVEEGQPLSDRPGTYRLDGYEVAARLSFFLWGVTPDDVLLDAAAAGDLDDADGVRSTAAWMLEDQRARSHVSRFHAAWLGYLEPRQDDGLTESMRMETNAVIERVLFDERRPWADLFTFEQTYVDDQLADLYGLTPPADGQAQWVDLPPETGRAGVLGHASVLSVDAKASYATRPVARGHRMSTVLLCQPVPPPPDDVDLDVDEAEGGCKTDALEAHAQGPCIGCHQFMDGLGLGIEAYDGLGRLRTHEIDAPGCEIETEGSFPPFAGEPAKPFDTPAQLGQLMVESEQLQACATTQLVRFAVGRTIRRKGVKSGIHEEDVPLVDDLIGKLGKDGRFDELVLELVSSPFFLHRVEY